MPIECEVEFRRLDRKSFQKLDFEVMRLSFESHNTLGRNCEESVYRNDLAARAGQMGGLCIRTETLVRVRHLGFIKEYRIDLAVDDASVYELKAAKALSAEHEGQTLNYLHLVGCEHGKLVNFGGESVESRFVNNPVPGDQRRRFSTVFDAWTGPETLKTGIVDFIEDIGLFLENALYNQAMLHRFGDPEHALERRPLMRGHCDLGRQSFQMCAPDEAFRITSLSHRLQSQRESFQKLVELSDLRAFHWINLNRHEIEFRSISR